MGSDIQSSVLELYQTLKKDADDGDGRIYVSTCCGRVYLGVFPPTKCGTCDKPVASTGVSKEGDLTAWLDSTLQKSP